jgi:endonuclease/exonuclease/phosphatase family metal-dependent hydrolase
MEKHLSAGLRVASYNIRHGADVNLQMQVLADDITGLNIDVVGLQEVDIGAARSGGIDTMAALSAASGDANRPISTQPALRFHVPAALPRSSTVGNTMPERLNTRLTCSGGRYRLSRLSYASISWSNPARKIQSGTR